MLQLVMWGSAALGGLWYAQKLFGIPTPKVNSKSAKAPYGQNSKTERRPSGTTW